MEEKSDGKERSCREEQQGKSIVATGSGAEAAKCGGG